MTLGRTVGNWLMSNMGRVFSLWWALDVSHSFVFQKHHVRKWKNRTLVPLVGNPLLCSKSLEVFSFFMSVQMLLWALGPSTLPVPIYYSVHSLFFFKVDFFFRSKYKFSNLDLIQMILIAMLFGSFLLDLKVSTGDMHVWTMGAPIEVGGILKELPQFLPDYADWGCFWMAFHQDHLSFLPMRLSYLKWG